MTSTKRFHVSGSTHRNYETGLVTPALLTEEVALSTMEVLASGRENVGSIKSRVVTMEIGEWLSGHNFGLIIRVADAT